MNEFGSEVLVPLAGIFCVFGLPVLAFIFFRVLAHRERMEMIRNGLAPGAPRARDWRNVAATPGGRMSPGGFGSSDFSYEAARITLRKGISLTFIGFAVTLGLSFIGYREGIGGVSWHPGPWLLGGLVPMFVGLAQVIIALLSGASLRPATAQSVPQFHAESPLPEGPPQATYDTSYTYRPGSTQELRPPPAPPREPRN